MQEEATPPVIYLSRTSGLQLKGARRLADGDDDQHDVVTNDGSKSVTYSYICEAEGQCDLPSATAKDYWDTQINVTKKVFKLQEDGNVTRISECCDTTFPSTYEIRYDAVDRAGNLAKQVVINLFVRGELVLA